MSIVYHLTIKPGKKWPSEIFQFWNIDFLVLAHFGSDQVKKTVN